MTFIASDKIDEELRKIGVRLVLAQYGRYRIAPGFTVADYVKIGEFYRNAGRHVAHEGQRAEVCALER